ncbi:MAG: DUF1028 domain-containing protein [Gemmataceae bacterium]|nr:DUF1028 domain-containing protein [Gemmataceae bacterium]MDW8265111.1 DUF1028 domain-containing protein [Gemmataceae bacterium]
MARASLALLVAGLALWMVGERPQAPRGGLVHTFSIVAYDPRKEEWGVGVASKYLAVGAVVPWAEAGVGAIATQSFVNVSYGPKGLKLLAAGKTAAEVVKELTEADDRREVRQLGVVDAQGNAANFTGDNCVAWAGAKMGRHYTCQGNLLAGEEVLGAMARAFENTTGPLAWRIMAALEAGERAGGDRRGKQSAAILVVRAEGGPGGLNDRFIDFRVDDHAEPVRELARILGLRLPRPETTKP